jgi:CRP-like cAMP-binding protein
VQLEARGFEHANADAVPRRLIQVNVAVALGGVMLRSLDSIEPLRAVGLLGALNEAQLQAIGKRTRRLTLNAGEQLFEHGQPASRFFYLERGGIVLKRMSADGTEKVIEIVRPGQTFGEAIMFMGAKTYPVTAAAIEPSDLLGFDNEAFLDLLRESVDSCFRLLADMSRRLRRWINEVESLTLQNATCRVVYYLFTNLPEGATSPATLNLPAPKHIIASRLSITPETLSRVLRQLTDAKAIEVNGPQVTIPDLKSLLRHAQI